MKAHSESFWHKVVKEIKSIAGVTLYFFLWLELLMILKRLMLKDYQIEFSGISIAIISALIMAKVALLLDLIKSGAWIRRKPAIVEVVLRTLLYTIAVLFVQLLEKAFESRHEAGGFGKALAQVFYHRDIYKVWAGTIVVGISLFFFNVYSIMKQFLPGFQFARILFNIPQQEVRTGNNS